MKPWFTIRSAQLTWAPIGTFVNQNGELRTKFIKIGVKITMEDGSWWFYSFKHDSWTKHWPAVRKLDRLNRPAVEAGKPVYLPERKDNYSHKQFVREWGKRNKDFVLAMATAVNEAQVVEN